jgi:hypothetical protein
LNSQKGRAYRRGWDFLADPAQFKSLLEFADHSTRGFEDFISQINAGRYIEWVNEKMRKKLVDQSEQTENSQ